MAGIQKQWRLKTSQKSPKCPGPRRNRGRGGMHQEREETEGVVGVLKIGQNVCKGRYLSKK